MTQTHYEVLELTGGAAPEEVRKAYRRLAARLHPDLHPEQLKEAATREFVKIQLAYEELSNPERRRTYDQSLAAEIRRREEAAAAAAQPKPTPQQSKPAPKPAPKPKPESDPEPEDLKPAAGRENIHPWHIWTAATFLLALTVAGYWIAGTQISAAESGWGKIYPVLWMAITFLLICLACFEDGVLYSMFLTIGAVGVAAALLNSVSWKMMGTQLGFTLVIVGVVKVMSMLIADRRDEHDALKQDRACA